MQEIENGNTGGEPYEGQGTPDGGAGRKLISEADVREMFGEDPDSIKQRKKKRNGLITEHISRNGKSRRNRRPSRTARMSHRTHSCP